MLHIFARLGYYRNILWRLFGHFDCLLSITCYDKVQESQKFWQKIFSTSTNVSYPSIKDYMGVYTIWKTYLTKISTKWNRVKCDGLWCGYPTRQIIQKLYKVVSTGYRLVFSRCKELSLSSKPTLCVEGTLNTFKEMGGGGSKSKITGRNLKHLGQSEFAFYFNLPWRLVLCQMLRYLWNSDGTYMCVFVTLTL